MELLIWDYLKLYWMPEEIKMQRFIYYAMMMKVQFRVAGNNNGGEIFLNFEILPE